jgi:hypothetical protein
MSKRECHPKFSESHTKKVEYYTNSKNQKYEINITQNLVNSTQKILKTTQNVLIKIVVIKNTNNYHDLKKSFSSIFIC